MNTINKLILFKGINKFTKPEYKSIENNNIATFNTKHIRYLKDLSISIKPAQSGSGVATPDNVRNFLERTSARLYVSPTRDSADATIYNINWEENGSIYGGKLNILTGELKKTHKVAREVIVSSAITSISTREDSTTLFWYYDASILSTDDIENSFCNVATYSDKNIPLTESENNKFSAMDAYPHSWWMRFSTALIGNTKDSILAYFEENPIYFYFKLASEETYSIDPITVQTLLGANNVWCDCGDIVKITYQSN